jgi:multisubunit Na+/H+ antiporter MnhC subunit
VLCLLLLGHRWRGHVVVVPGGVLVMCQMAKDPVAVVLVLTSLADHSFLLVVIASLLD